MLHSAVTIDASITVEEALKELKAYDDRTAVVIRRREGSMVYWYAMQVGNIRELTKHIDPNSITSYTLKQALDLHEHGSSDCYQLREIYKDTLDELYGVLLDGSQVVGVLEPPPRAAAMTSLPRFKITGPRSERILKSIFNRFSKKDEPLASPATRPYYATPDIQSISAYPRLDAPDNVTPNQQFYLAIGLSPTQYAGVAGGPMEITTAEEEFDLIVNVIAHGFQAPEGARRFLHVKRGSLEEAETKVKLIAPFVEELFFSSIEIEYSYQGNLLGKAWREIRVIPAGFEAPDETASFGMTPIHPSFPETAPDLTVTISESQDGFTLQWRFISPFAIEIPSGQVETRFKQHNAQTFATNEIKSVADADGTLFMNNRVLGIARNIADQMPFEFWDVLVKVWKQVQKERPGDVPYLLLVSSEPYIPWELASTEKNYIDETLIDSGRPPLIGAQLRVGRWLPEGPRTPRGLGRPELPPNTTIDIMKIALVVGDYAATSGLRPLPKAKEEGEALSKRYPGVQISATEKDVNLLLEDRLTDEKGKPVSVQAIHFACHGEVNPGTQFNGIVLSDNNLRLNDIVIRGNQMTQIYEPFVFLNACQLGLSSEILADYGGLAGAFLKEGCQGFIAPLWSVDDDIARDLALEFYKCALDENTEVSEVMRQLRSKFDIGVDTSPSTHIAYVFYGHPKLVLNKV